MRITPEGYARHKERMAARSRERSIQGREIGHIPPVRDPERKVEGLSGFRAFLELYFPDRFPLPWGDHHIKYIERTEAVVLDGGLHAVAMPRSDGKTTIIEIAPIWASVTGQHHYTFIVGASEDKASEMLESIKVELAYNDRLLADFPEVCYPIRMLEGDARRARGQLHQGERTNIKWGDTEIRLPDLPGSPGSGAVIRAAGITGNIRGAVKTLQSGRRVRPTLVVIDDPQTDESAYSPAQCDKRHRIIMGSILGLAGAGKAISSIMTCTVVREDDLSDRILDREKSPDWTGERTKMVDRFPENEELWDRYAEKRLESLERYGDIRLATAFYRKNREEMDHGAKVTWSERYNRQGKNAEISAIQHAMNLRYRDERAFFAEYQNDPLPEIPPDTQILSAAEIAAKDTATPRGIVPAGSTILVAHIDVQDRALWYGVAAFRDDFSGHACDYGAFPDQRADYYTLRSLKLDLQARYKGEGLGWEGMIYRGLGELVDRIAGEWPVEGGATMRPSRILIDAAYGNSTDTVYQFSRHSAHAPILMPAFGRGIGAAHQPMNEYKKKPGERVGHNWRIPNVGRSRSIRHLIYDANYWKSFLHARLRVGMGDPGGFVLHDPGKGHTHRMLADQLTAEQRVVTEGRGRVVDEWKHTDRTRDNHFLDVFTACHVAACMEGARIPEMQGGASLKQRERVRFSDLQRQKMGWA